MCDDVYLHLDLSNTFSCFRLNSSSCWSIRQQTLSTKMSVPSHNSSTTSSSAKPCFWLCCLQLFSILAIWWVFPPSQPLPNGIQPQADTTTSRTSSKNLHVANVIWIVVMSLKCSHTARDSITKGSAPSLVVTSLPMVTLLVMMLMLSEIDKCQLLLACKLHVHVP